MAARFNFERLKKKKQRKTAHVADSDVAEGRKAITRTHANVLKCKSRVDDVVETLTALQAAAFPEASFHMFVWHSGCRCLQQVVTGACLFG